MWRGAISSQITAVFPCHSDREGEGGRERSKKNHSKGRKGNGKVKQEIQREMGGWEAGLLPLFSLAATHAFERIFSSGKISADDTVVEMKTPQRLVDVTVIDS